MLASLMIMKKVPSSPDSNPEQFSLGSSLDVVLCLLLRFGFSIEISHCWNMNVLLLEIYVCFFLNF